MINYFNSAARSWARTQLNRFFYLRKGRMLRRILAKKEIHGLKPFKLERWHHDICTFTAEHGRERAKAFIKVSRVKGLLENERRAYEIVSNNKLLAKYAIGMFDYFSEGSFDVLVLEFQTGQILKDEWMLDNLQELGGLFEIVKELSSLSLVHRDLKPDNLMLSGNRIKMFDFTFMISEDSKWGLKELDVSEAKNMETLRALGHGFKPSTFEWDDYYSLYVIFSNLHANPSLSLTREQEIVLSGFIKKSRENVTLNRYILPME